MRPKIFKFSPAPRYTYLVVRTCVSSKSNITVMRTRYPLAEIFRYFCFGLECFSPIYGR